MPPMNLSRTLHFGSFAVNHQIFHVTPLSFALVNLKPLLPGHVLVCPQRVVPRVSELTSAEVSDLFQAIQRVGRMVEGSFNATALNIAIQDGKDAGQSVPHVHAHVIPRKPHDLDDEGGSDAIYGKLDSDEGNVGKHFSENTKRTGNFARPDAERLPRSDEEMQKEAEWLAREMEKYE